MKLLVILLIFAGIPAFSLGQSQPQRKVTLPAPIAEGKIGGFLESVPTDYTTSSTKRYPLIIFIHGVGEVGNGSTTALEKMKRNGPPQLINTGNFPTSFTVNGQVYRFLVMCPQFNSRFPSPQVVQEFITYVKKNYRVDTNRIYLTGLSMGGGTVWSHSGYSAEYAQKLAAIAPFCGAASANQARSGIMASRNLPIWAFHNLNDGAVDVRNTTGAVRYYNSYSPTPFPLARMSLFEGISHNCWTKGYDPRYRENGYNLYEWFLLHSRAPGYKTPVPLVNEKPISLAGNDQSVVMPASSTTLSGTLSYDNDGTLSKYNWKQVGGSNAVFNNASLVQTVVSGLTTAGKYTFVLTVTDNDGASDTDTMIVKVGGPTTNVLPVVVVEGPTTIKLPATSVQLDCSKSYDTDGYVKTRYWYQIAGNAVKFSNQWVGNPTISGLTTVGKYTVVARITDDLNGVSTDTIVLNVTSANAKNIPPVAIAEGLAKIIQPVSTVSLDGSKSYDTDGTIKSRYWYQVSGPIVSFSNQNSATTTVSGLKNVGNYSFALKVTDDSSSVNIDTISVTVAAGATNNIPPVAIAEISADTANRSTNVTLTGKSSYDPDGKIKNYFWYQVGGPLVTFNNVWFVSPTVSGISAPGEYVLVLRVTDTLNLASTDTLKIYVGVLPVSNAGADVSITLPVSGTTLDGTASYVPGGTIKNYYWSQIGASNAVISNRWLPKPVVSGLTTAGTYQFSLRISDLNNNLAYDTMVITVNQSIAGKNTSVGQSFERDFNILNNRIKDFSIYPNPLTNSTVTISIHEQFAGKAQLNLFNASGVLIWTERFEKPVGKFQRLLNFGALQQGNYFLELIINKKLIKTEKLIR
jgi:hypothetical protein